jgi:cytochrome c-type biogenesis protein CcmH
VEPDERLGDAVLEDRARDIGRELRCLVCRNQSIDDSNADLAHDLRVLIRQRLTAGDSDEETIEYVVARYGDYVLLKPPFKPVTYLLWIGPAIFGLLSFAVILVYFRRSRARTAETMPLTDHERRRLESLLPEDKR